MENLTSKEDSSENNYTTQSNGTYINYAKFFIFVAIAVILGTILGFGITKILGFNVILSITSIDVPYSIIPGSVFQELIHRIQRKGYNLDARDHRHKVSIAHPPRHNVNMHVTGESGSRHLPYIEPYAISVGF